MRRRSAAVHAQSDLVERALRTAGPCAVVVGALALLELVHDLAVAGGGLERVAARGHLGVLAVEVERRLAAVALGTLDERLGGDQVHARRAGEHGVAAGLGGGGGGVRRLAQHRLAA